MNSIIWRRDNRVDLQGNFTAEQLRELAEEAEGRQNEDDMFGANWVVIDGTGWAEAAFDGYQPYQPSPLGRPYWLFDGEQRAGVDSLAQRIARMPRADIDICGFLFAAEEKGFKNVTIHGQDAAWAGEK